MQLKEQNVPPLFNPRVVSEEHADLDSRFVGSGSYVLQSCEMYQSSGVIYIMCRASYSSAVEEVFRSFSSVKVLTHAVKILLCKSKYCIQNLQSIFSKMYLKCEKFKSTNSTSGE